MDERSCGAFLCYDMRIFMLTRGTFRKNINIFVLRYGTYNEFTRHNKTVRLI